MSQTAVKRHRTPRAPHRMPRTAQDAASAVDDLPHHTSGGVLLLRSHCKSDGRGASFWLVEPNTDGVANRTQEKAVAFALKTLRQACV